MATRRQSPYVHKPAICQAAVTYLQFSIQVCFPCNDHAQPAMPTSATDTLASPTLVALVLMSSVRCLYVKVRRNVLATLASPAAAAGARRSLHDARKQIRSRRHGNCLISTSARDAERTVQIRDWSESHISSVRVCVCVRAGLENALSLLHAIRRCHATDVSVYASARPASFHGMKTFSYTLSARRRQRNQTS